MGLTAGEGQFSLSLSLSLFFYLQSLIYYHSSILKVKSYKLFNTHTDMSARCDIMKVLFRQ